MCKLYIIQQFSERPPKLRELIFRLHKVFSHIWYGEIPNRSIFTYDIQRIVLGNSAT